jgi:hypothetical protein
MQHEIERLYDGHAPSLFAFLLNFTRDGQFILYSVGWNETDDGGVVVLKKGRTPSIDRKEGDWVWQYPGK